MYKKTYNQYKTELNDQVPIDTPHLGYFSINDPRHVDYIPPPTTPLEYHDPQEQFLAGGLHHIATLEGPQAQLSPTHLVLPAIEQAAAQKIEIPVNIQPIASTSAVIILGWVVQYERAKRASVARGGSKRSRLVGGWESPHRPSLDLICLIRTPIQTEIQTCASCAIGSGRSIAGAG